ncbi:MAG: hypothetical protein IKR70_07350 [Lachnospiraceae bacterium]|nr:hypothetical protein [Lachnospiraceae bacterium]
MEPIKDGDYVIIKSNPREKISDALNVIIICLAGAGVGRMIDHKDDAGVLMASGLENLKYFTVLSNIFCLIVAIIFIVLSLMRKKCPIILKLISVSGVALTFAIVAFFLAPMYPDLNMYEGTNRFFHLIVPIVAMIEFIMYEQERKMPFKYTFFAAIPSLIYGNFYLANCLINGIGEWPETNDWYGFLNWGYPVGMVIFAGVVLANWGIACLFWWIKQYIR